MKDLVWSENKDGNWNGKCGPYTLFTISYHQDGALSSWWVHPKLPGLKSKQVVNESEGKALGNQMFQDWLMVTGIGS